MKTHNYYCRSNFEHNQKIIPNEHYYRTKNVGLDMHIKTAILFTAMQKKAMP